MLLAIRASQNWKRMRVTNRKKREDRRHAYVNSKVTCCTGVGVGVQRQTNAIFEKTSPHMFSYTALSVKEDTLTKDPENEVDISEGAKPALRQIAFHPVRVLRKQSALGMMEEGKLS